MNEINGQEIRVILGIKQGRKFGCLGLAPTNGIFIEAILDGNILDTDVVPVSEEPTFDSELMWECNKILLRRLRTAGNPIKVNCFSVDSMRTKKDRIGSFIINLRQAHIVPSGKFHSEIGESWWEWQKLIAAKSPYPELLCSLRLEEKLKSLSQPSKEKRNRRRRKIMVQHPHPNPCLITRLHSDKGIIQIGSDETAVDNFTLTIYVGLAVNLDLLLPGNYHSENPAEDEQLCFHYSVMDYAINTAMIAMKNIYKPLPLNEKMVISLCSSLENLQQYFMSSSKLVMKLMIGQNEVGFTEASMKGLVPTTDKDTFLDLHPDDTVTIERSCFLKGSKTGEVPTSPSGLQPQVSLKLMLKFLEDQQDDAGGEAPRLLRSASYTVLDSLQKVPTVDSETSRSNCQQAAGDVIAGNEEQLMKEVKKQPADMHSASSCQLRRTCSHIVKKTCKSEPEFHNNSTQMSKSSQVYCLTITVESATFKQALSQSSCYFRFHHPKAEIVCKSIPEVVVTEENKELQLQNVTCKMNFVSTHEEINHMLLTCPPKITICDTALGQGNQFAVATLNLAPVLTDVKKQGQCNIPLVDLTTNEEIVSIAVALALTDCGSQQIEDGSVLDKDSEQDLGPPTRDDRIAFRIVEELEDWKERQQKLFKEELKRKERIHLSSLTEEWKKHCLQLQKNLLRNMEKCRSLAQSLNDTTDDLRQEAFRTVEKEQYLNRFKEMAQQKYKLKVLAMREANRRLKDDLSFKIVKLEREKEDLEERLLKVEKENCLLKETVKAQELELDNILKTSLTKDQTAAMLQELKLLEEKLEVTCKSKSFFKEQWARAVREILRLKCEHRKEIQIQIKHNKEELRNLGLQHLLGEGEKELEEDKAAIQVLHANINAMKTFNSLAEPPQFVGSHFVPSSTSLHLLHTEKLEKHPKVKRSQVMRVRSLTNLRNIVFDQESLNQMQIMDGCVIVMQLPSLRCPQVQFFVPHSITTATKDLQPISSTNLNVASSSTQMDKNEVRLRALMEERDTLMNTGNYSLDDPVIVKLNQEIRLLLKRSNGIT
ncbi:centrosomal protein of 120 kDa-like isoform X2 [Periplaneta americana]|uniref:centrosomal protein of 120 kDa-like isoform X2 n=1 Tax=Periplaneta americana TaxID=6978 RepID=UPI0037E7394E